MTHWQLRSIAATLALLISLFSLLASGVVGGAAIPAISSVVAAQRSQAAVREFRKANPCPAAREGSGVCPGFVVDHIVPLCAGGDDHPRNMQWQTVEAAKIKDRDERAQCAALRKTRP